MYIVIFVIDDTNDLRIRRRGKQQKQTTSTIGTSSNIAIEHSFNISIYEERLSKYIYIYY